MDLAKIIENEIIKDNEFLKSLGVEQFEVVDKVKIGDTKTIDFRNLDTGVVATVTVEGRGVIKYDGRVLNLPNMFGICEQVLGVKF